LFDEVVGTGGFVMVVTVGAQLASSELSAQFFTPLHLKKTHHVILTFDSFDVRMTVVVYRQYYATDIFTF